MFQDQLTRNSQNAFSWYIGWERYTLLTALFLGLTASAAIGQLVAFNDLREVYSVEDGTKVEEVEACGKVEMIARYMIVVVGQST